MRLPEPRDDPDWRRARAHDVEELWDHNGAPHVATSYAARVEMIIRLVRRLAGPGDRVLDVGCAQGTYGLMLAEQGLRVSLLDVRAGYIEYAKARWERGEVEFYVGTVSDEYPPRRDYDVVLCTEVIEHVSAPAALLDALRRKVRPGGTIVLTTPNADYLVAGLPTYGRASQAVIDDGDAHRYLFTQEEPVALVRSVALRVEGSSFFLPL